MVEERLNVIGPEKPVTWRRRSLNGSGSQLLGEIGAGQMRTAKGENMLPSSVDVKRLVHEQVQRCTEY